MKNSKHFNISDTDFNRIRVSKAKPFKRENKSYKHYIFYEDGGKHIPLNICFSNTLLGYCNEYINKDKDNNVYISGKMKFALDNDLVYNIMNIFEYIEKKLEIDLQEYIYYNGKDDYLNAKIYKRTRFNKKGCKGTSINPGKNTKYECKPLLQIQSIYYASEDKKDIAYYPQILVEQCGYKIFIEYNIVPKDFVFTDSEADDNDDNDDNDE